MRRFLFLRRTASVTGQILDPFPRCHLGRPPLRSATLLAVAALAVACSPEVHPGYDIAALIETHRDAARAQLVAEVLWNRTCRQRPPLPSDCTTHFYEIDRLRSSIQRTIYHDHPALTARKIYSMIRRTAARCLIDEGFTTKEELAETAAFPAAACAPDSS